MGLLIVSKNAILRDAIKRLCETRNIAVSAVYDDCQDVGKSRIGQLMLVHIESESKPPLKNIEGVLDKFSGLRLVILAPSHLVQQIETLYQGRLAATVSESASAETLVSVLVLAMGGYSARMTAKPLELESFSTRSGDKSYENNDTSSPDDEAEKLSDREMAVMSYLKAGYSNKEIARALGIQDSTVKAHLRSSFRRIGATNRTQAAMWAMLHLSHMHIPQIESTASAK